MRIDVIIHLMKFEKNRIKGCWDMSGRRRRRRRRRKKDCYVSYPTIVGELQTTGHFFFDNSGKMYNQIIVNVIKRPCSVIHVVEL